MGECFIDNSIYTRDELLKMGFKALGNNVLISKKSSFYGVKKISIGDNVRIDDFCVLTGGEKGIEIGSYIHIAAFCYISGQGGVQIREYCNISSRNSIYSSSDDYSGEFMTNPMIPERFTNVSRAKITLNKHVIIGTGSTILPGVEIEEGVAVGAMSLVNKDLESWGMYAGIPAKFIKPRKKGILELERQFKEYILDDGDY